MATSTPPAHRVFMPPLLLFLLLLPFALNMHSTTSASPPNAEDILYQGKFEGKGPGFFIRRLAGGEDEAGVDEFFTTNFYQPPSSFKSDLGKHILALYHQDAPAVIVSAIAAVHIGDFATYLKENFPKLTIKTEWWGEGRRHFENSFNIVGWVTREGCMSSGPTLLHYFHHEYLAGLEPSQRPDWLTVMVNRGLVYVNGSYLHLGYHPFALEETSLKNVFRNFFLRRGGKPKLEEMLEVEEAMCTLVRINRADFDSPYFVDMYRQAFTQEMDTCSLSTPRPEKGQQPPA